MKESDSIDRGPVTLSLRRLGRLTHKELSESLRDRRTIFTLVLMPLILYPILTIAFQQLMLSKQADKVGPVYRIGFVSNEEKVSMMTWWKHGQNHLIVRHAPSGGTGQQPPLPAYLDPLPDLIPIDVEDIDEAVRIGRVDVGVRLRPKGGFRLDTTTPPFLTGSFHCDLIYREGSQKGLDAVRFLELLTADANSQLLSQRLRWVPPAARRQLREGVRAHAVTVPDDTAKRSALTPVLIPLILILMTMTGAVYPAIDLTAGERERGTLALLVASPVPRMNLLLAKYVAVFTVAMLTALVNLGAMTLTLEVTGVGAALFHNDLNFLVLVQVLALLLLFSAFFSAVALALTSFARSFKEAQAYLVPLMLLCLVPGMMALLPGLDLRGPLAVAPLINIVLLARDIFDGSARPAIAVVVVTTTLLYALAAVALAARIFGTEAVLTSEASGWSDLFRRPRDSRRVAEPAGALLCLAVMFPAYFLVTTGLARLPRLDLIDRLELTALVSVVLMAGFPLAAAWLGRVRLSSGLRFHAPGPMSCAAAVLLGVSLWPFAHELGLLLARFQVTTMTPELQEKASAMIAQWREYSPLLSVAVLALIPAFVEELFFRGYLFAALLGDGRQPGRAIFGSAALFALFHLLVGGSLLVERLPPSFVLGGVLGWLCYRSGSIVPGMVLHALHNSVLVLLAYYQPRLSEGGWPLGTEDHLPAWLLAAAAGGALLGLALVGGLKEKRPAEAIA
jgi:sodium transport system permease protein